MNAKIFLFVIYVEVIIYLLLCNLHDCTFKAAINSIQRWNCVKCLNQDLIKIRLI